MLVVRESPHKGLEHVAVGVDQARQQDLVPGLQHRFGLPLQLLHPLRAAAHLPDGIPLDEDIPAADNIVAGIHGDNPRILY